MHARLRFAIALFFVVLSGSVYFLWYHGGIIGSAESGVLAYLIVASLLVSGAWLIAEMAFKIGTGYEDLPPDDQAKVGVLVEDCIAVKRGEKDWCDALYSRF